MNRTNRPENLNSSNAKPLTGFDNARMLLSDNKGAVTAIGIVAVFLALYRVGSGIPIGSFQVTILSNGGLPLSFATLGLAFVVISGGIDLSIGSIVSLTNVIATSLLTGKYPHDLGIIAILLLVGFITGLINGLFVAVVRVPSFIVTLAALFIWSGCSLLILEQPGGFIPDNFASVFSGHVGTTPVPMALVWLLAVLVGLYFLRRTKFYTDIFAIGSSEEAAFRSGVRVSVVKSLVYAVAGLCYAISGIFLSAQTTGGDPNIGNSYLLVTFAALVVGGTPFGGGRGTFVGALFGGYIMSLIDNLLLSFNVSSFAIDVVRGLIVILAVSMSSAGPEITALWRRLIVRRS